jgi:hypothetical protein
MKTTRFTSIEIVRQINDLERTVWTFIILDATLILNHWSVQRRETKRHKFVSTPDTRWSRLDNRGNNVKERPTPPPSVVEEALVEARFQISYEEWVR